MWDFIVFFNFVRDEDSYDDGTIMIDDEPDEVQAFYEEFLKTTGKSN